MIQPKESPNARTNMSGNKEQLYNRKNNNRRVNNDENNKETNNNKNNNNNNNLCHNNNSNSNKSNQNRLQQQKEIQREHEEWNIIQNIEPWGDNCIPIDDGDEETMRLYCQNVNGIYDIDGLGLNETFHHMRTTKAHIFTLNETHGDDTNPDARAVLRRSKQRLWQNQDGFCTINTSSSDAMIQGFSKPGGNMVGITGHLCGRIRAKIDDKFGRWCGFSLLGKDGREILIITAYNVCQITAAGDDTLYQQQKSQYLREYNDNNITSDKEAFIDPKKRFIKDL